MPPRHASFRCCPYSVRPKQLSLKLPYKTNTCSKRECFRRLLVKPSRQHPKGRLMPNIHAFCRSSRARPTSPARLRQGRSNNTSSCYRITGNLNEHNHSSGCDVSARHNTLNKRYFIPGLKLMFKARKLLKDKC